VSGSFAPKEKRLRERAIRHFGPRHGQLVISVLDRLLEEHAFSDVNPAFDAGIVARETHPVALNPTRAFVTRTEFISADVGDRGSGRRKNGGDDSDHPSDSWITPPAVVTAIRDASGRTTPGQLAIRRAGLQDERNALEERHARWRHPVIRPPAVKY
jgi:hypothetical protein